MRWKDRIGTFIPRYVPNRLVAGIMRLLNILHRTSKKQVEKNRIHNTKILMENADTSEMISFYKPDGFVENQSQWRDVHFGSKYTMAYGGCGIFAVYNALIALGKKPDGSDMVKIISELERSGAVWGGKLGIAPYGMRKFFVRRGYRTHICYSRDKSVIGILGETYDTFIVTVYNDAKNIFRFVHNVSITKDERGRFRGHNCYKRRMLANGDSIFVSDGPHPGLWEAIHRMSDGKAEILSVIGIKAE
ncbi:MAG: hypothetical protein J6B39_03580 [Lachnospiraceae bacterium]|nr:hypothetical protein [Lachnospiraceae bacterium]